MGVSTIFHFVLNPDFTNDSIRHLLFSLQGIGVGIGLLHSEFKLMAYKWTQKLEYRNTPADTFAVKDIAAGNAIIEFVRVPLLTCEGLF